MPGRWDICPDPPSADPMCADVMPSARSVIMTGTLYNAGEPYSTERDDPRRGEVARYAWSEDYHHVLGRAARSRWSSGCGSSIPSRSTRAPMSIPVPCRSACTRSTPASAGLARTPASSIHERGSWMLLGAIVCSLPLAARCAGARPVRHLHAVPRSVPNRSVRRAARARRDDVASRTSTIEYRGSIPEEHRDEHRQPPLRLRRLPGSVPVERRRRERRSVLVVARRT